MGPTTRNIGSGVVLTANSAFDSEAGAVWNLSGNSVFASGANTLINAGTINASGTSGITSGGSLSVTNTGTVNVLSGTFDIAPDVSGSGTFTIANAALLEIGGAVGLGAIVTLLGATGTLTLDHSETSPFEGQISNLDASASSHDSIDLADMTFTAQSSAQYAASGPGSNSGVLTVSDGNGHTETFNLIKHTGAGVFITQSDGAGGTLVFVPPRAGQSGGCIEGCKLFQAFARVPR